MAVPDVPGEHRRVASRAARPGLALGGADRVLGLALVQLQRALAVGILDHAGVLVLGLRLVDHPAAVLGVGLERADRQRDQHRDRGGRERPAAQRAQAGHRGQRYREREYEKGAARADERYQEQRREERADERARRRQRVEPPSDRAGLLHRRHRQPDRPGRHRAEQQHRDRHQHEHADERPEEGARRDLVERVDRDVEHRVGDERDDRQEPRRRQREQAQAAHGGVAVGQPAAEPVADRERHEDDPDRVRPDDRRSAEIRGEQAYSGNLGAERARPHHEDEEGQRRHCAAERS